jgi:hypothetical protein
MVKRSRSLPPILSIMVSSRCSLRGGVDWVYSSLCPLLGRSLALNCLLWAQLMGKLASTIDEKLAIGTKYALGSSAIMSAFVSPSVLAYHFYLLRTIILSSIFCHAKIYNILGNIIVYHSIYICLFTKYTF